MRKDLLNLFEVSILDRSYEGILWVSFKDKVSNICFNVCTCYLPPHGSSRYVSAQEFYDQLLTNIYEYQHLGKFILCGDFNSRIGDMADFIEGVDVIQDRNVIDYSKNMYGEFLCNFLIDSNCCILNGRQCKTIDDNDFTFVSTRGNSVVDYFIVPYENIEQFEGFKVVRPAQLYAHSLNVVESRIVPDHSIIVCCLNLKPSGSDVRCNTENFTTEKRYTRYNLTNIPPSFCHDEHSNSLFQTLNNLVTNLQSQQDVDKIYSEFCSIVQSEMSLKLPKREIVVKFGVSNKRRRIRKPWWSDDLQAFWNDMCDAEKAWLKCRNSQKHNLKHIFVQKRKLFDQQVQRRKRKYWFEMQNEMVSNAENNPNDFWKTIGRTGVRDNRKREIPMEIVNDNGEIITDSNAVLKKWETSFSALLNPAPNQEINWQNIDVMQNVDNTVDESGLFADHFTLSEVRKAIYSIKHNRAVGVDEIPGEVLKNDSTVTFLHKLFNACYRSGKVPDIWGKSLICPIPKCTTSESRDPLSYRGIAISPVVYKVYCTLLNNRVSIWSNYNNLIFEGQNGFRKGRSTIDYISSLTNIIETRKKMKKSTFCAFVDFKKAYDSVNREILWVKLEKLGFNGLLLDAIKALYNNVQSSVKLNGPTTDWFNVNCGLKQGCSLSPILFNLYINDLALKIDALGQGVKIDDDTVSVLLYADDVVLIAETEANLQSMLDILGSWCKNNLISVNAAKSNIVHFRNPSEPQSDTVFTVNDENILYTMQYKYLGIVLSEHLDYAITAKKRCTVCKSRPWSFNS